jgi:hypothetical protein
MAQYHNQEWFLNNYVQQAAGVVAVQLGCSPKGALARLILRSANMRQEVEDTALDVLDGVIRFDR